MAKGFSKEALALFKPFAAQMARDSKIAMQLGTDKVPLQLGTDAALENHQAFRQVNSASIQGERGTGSLNSVPMIEEGIDEGNTETGMEPRVRTEPNVSAGQSLRNLNREDIARAISIGRSVSDEWCRANNTTGELANVLGSAAIIGALRAMIRSLHPDLSEADFETQMQLLHLVPAEIFNFEGIGASADENANESSPTMPQPGAGATGGPALGSHIGLGPVGYSTDEQSRLNQMRSRRQH